MKAVCKIVPIVFLLATSLADSGRAQSDVAVGYQLMYNPWKAAIASGEVERATSRSGCCCQVFGLRTRS